MTANQVFLVFLGFVAIVSLLLPVFSLKLGLKWAKVTNVSLLKAFGLCLLVVLLGYVVCFCALFVYMFLPVRHSELAMNLIGGVLYFIVICAEISLIYKVRFLRATLAVIPFLLSSLHLLGSYLSNERLFTKPSTFPPIRWRQRS